MTFRVTDAYCQKGSEGELGILALCGVAGAVVPKHV